MDNFIVLLYVMYMPYTRASQVACKKIIFEAQAFLCCFSPLVMVRYKDYIPAVRRVVMVATWIT